jgi:hypothetical protein
VWSSEFTTEAATLQGDSEEFVSQAELEIGGGGGGGQKL